MKPLKEQFCVIDIETRGLNARKEAFIFGCLYADEGRYKKVFMSHKEMKDFLLSKKNPYKYIFAHNAEYDFTCLFGNLIKDFDYEALFVGSTFISAKQCGKNFCNSLPILKSSVKELGKNLGIEKLELDSKFIDGDKKIKVTSQDIEYCYRDCEIVYVFLQKIFSYTKKLKPTIASISMEIFKKNFLSTRLINDSKNEQFRHSYYGGRVECFQFGEIKDIYKYDVNSLYPFVCTKMKFPNFGKLKRVENMRPAKLKIIIQNNEGCANVLIEHKKNFVGVLPYRLKNEIIYPCGYYTSWYNFNELRAALKSGLIEIIKVHDCYYSEPFEFNGLSNYMHHFFNEKNTTEGAEKMIAKFILNSLTGKFAQKEYGKKIYFENYFEALNFTKCLPPKTKVKLHHFSEERDDLFIEIFNGYRKKASWNIPTISSYITSEARSYMLQFYLKYQKNLIYTDTDSLVLTCPMDKKYIDGDKLGFFKLEDEQHINIIGNKHYTSVSKSGKKTEHIKGVPKNYKKISDKDFSFLKMLRSKEALRRNTHAGMFVEVVKHLNNDYTKRTVKGNKTQILTINNLKKTA